MTDLSKVEVFEGNKLRKKVRAIISNQAGQFLLIQPHFYQENSWSFVGGGVEAGETFDQAMLRELREEVGINHFLFMNTSKIRPWYLFSEKLKNKKNSEFDGQIANIFWIEVENNTQIKLQVEEVKAYRWASLEEVRQLVTVPEQLAWFNAVVEELTLKKAA